MVVLSDSMLVEVTRRLVAELSPERIYLYGSHAYGHPGPSSDLDLAIILRGDDSDELAAARSRAAGLVGEIGCPVDIKVYAAGRFDRRSGWRANFEHTVRNKGRLLYGEDGMSFAREWVERASRDRMGAKRLSTGEPPLPGQAAFFCQQTVEKLLKAFLVQNNQPFEKVHDLGVLCDLCEKYDPMFGALRDRVQVLTRYAVSIRYPDQPDATNAEAGEAMKIADDIWDFVLQRLPASIQSVPPLSPPASADSLEQPANGQPSEPTTE